MKKLQKSDIIAIKLHREYILEWPVNKIPHIPVESTIAFAFS
jgi:hypothetical protein